MPQKTHERNLRASGAIFLLAAILQIAGCVLPNGESDSPPTIAFTYVPPFGSFDDLRGRTTSASAWAHRIVVYIRVGDTWWVKPSEAGPLTPIGFGGHWETDITTGGLDHEATEIRAFVVRHDFDARVNTLPAEDLVLASTTSVRSPTVNIEEVGRIGSTTLLRGSVTGAETDRYRIAAFIYVDGLWWVKPSEADPQTPIAADGTWAVDISNVPTDLAATRVWAGLVREGILVGMNELPEEVDVIASECLARGLTARDQVLPCNVEDMFEFAEDQLSEAGNDPMAGGLPAAFATDGTDGLPADFLEYADDRAFVYDTATILIAMARLTPDRREAYIRQAADALVFAIENDSAGDGRVRNEYYSTDIRASEPNRDQPSIRNAETHVGNAAWVILSLCDSYAATTDARYLTAAERVGSWVESQMRAYDEMGGYFGGDLFPAGLSGYTDEDLQRVEWRSVEHNSDLIAAFESLANLTSDSVWSERMDHARRFVESPSVYDCSGGYWYLGTTTEMEINISPLAEDTATWPWLAGVRPCGDAPLRWALSELRTVTNGFDGIRFTDIGEGVVTEPTAHLALALSEAGDAEVARELLRALERIQAQAPNTDSRGLVATPAPNTGVDSGLGASHYAAPNLAATAWAIFAATATNPFQAAEARQSP